MHQSTDDSGAPTQKVILKYSLWSAQFALVITSLLTVLLILQQFGGIGLTVSHSVKPDRIKSADGIYRWQLSEDYRSPLLNLKTILIEDNTPFLNRSTSARDLPKMGAGWFHVFRGNVKFLPTDGSDPRTSRHRYTVQTPLQFEPELWWAMGALLFALLLTIFWLRRRMDESQEQAIERARPIACFRRQDSPWQTLTVFTIALTMGITHLVLWPDHSDGIFIIKGIQESDAGGWQAMSLGLERGLGLTTVFESQRPFYSVLLAFVYWITKPSIFVGQAFNMILIAVACAGLWWTGQILRKRWLGAALVASVLVGGFNLPYAHGILTENSGIAFSVLALTSAWLAAWLLSPKWSAIAGAINGLGALASGVTLFTLPLYATWIFASCLWRGAPWRRVLLITALYTAGAAMVILPWMFRQQLVHGHFTLSFNTAEVLAGGASPTEGHIDAAMLRDAAAHGVDLADCEQRFPWFMDQLKQIVVADPVGYARRVLLAAAESLKSLPDASSPVPALLSIAFLMVALCRTWATGRITLFLAAVTVVLLWIRAEAEIEPAVLLAAAYLAFRRSRHPAERLAVGLLICTVIATLIISGLSGNVAPKRFWIVADWSVFALLSLGTWSLVELVSNLFNSALRAAKVPDWLLGTPNQNSAAVVDAPPLLRGSLIGVLAVSLLATIVSLGLTWRGPVSTAPDIAAFDPVTAGQTLMENHPESRLKQIDRNKIMSRIVMMHDRPAHLANGEGFQHWLPIYAARNYNRWITRFTLLDEDGVAKSELGLLGRGSLADIPQNELLLCVSATLLETNKLSGEASGISCACAIAPLQKDSETGKWSVDMLRARYFPPPIELIRSIAPKTKP